jgi:signal transduction histidine kinase
MAVVKRKTLTIRPYARILTMLGDQLIKNERIALIELIKNSYDADATEAEISFENFDDDYKMKENSKIIIQDSGHGMTSDILEKHWLNPATPEKKLRKRKKSKTPKGRIIQGEKGIGRFAMFKLGRKIRLITRHESENMEHVLEYDFSNYDNDFLTEDGVEKELYLDDLKVMKFDRTPKVFTEKKRTVGINIVENLAHGTRIEIGDLKCLWSHKKVESVFMDLSKLEPIFSVRRREKARKEGRNTKNYGDFRVWINLNGERQHLEENFLEKLNNLLDSKPVLKIEEGEFDAKKREYTFLLDGKPQKFGFSDPECYGLQIFKDRFGAKGEELKKRDIECGSFNFEFFVFDFRPRSKVSAKYLLDPDDKKILRQHRIYLYRDNIRVYPYGDQNDDWLNIDIHRGTKAAGHFLSNDQVVGQVDITQEGNPKLNDKTNREGLIEEGDATQDFIVILQIFLRYVRKELYKRYVDKNESKTSHEIFKKELVQNEFAELKAAIKDNKKAVSLLEQTEKKYKAERKYLTQRAETTEELAGVGLSVETASHDILMIMDRAVINVNGLIKECTMAGEIDKDALLKDLESLRGSLGMMNDQLRDVQSLFVSTKKRRKNIRVKDIVEKVQRIYARLLKKESIKITIKSTMQPLVAKTTDAVLLQLLLNLLDNSVYWLKQSDISNKKIEIVLDGKKNEMIFADNGPGIHEDDKAFIFEPFFSGKGEEGRGLGLYIARQLLERNDYSIELVELNSQKILEGANFLVNFVAEET